MTCDDGAMVLVALTVAVSVVVGWVRGGRLRNLAHARLRAAWLVVAAVGLQGVLAAVSAARGPVDVVGLPLLVASQIALLGFVFANRVLPGMTLVLLGFAMNAAVIIPNGAMPVSPAALEAITGEPTTFEPGKHRVLTDGDVLPWLADIIPLPLLRTVVSVGDIVLAAGVGIVVVDLMRRHRPRGAHAVEAAAEGLATRTTRVSP
jgi:hypothetical protein